MKLVILTSDINHELVQAVSEKFTVEGIVVERRTDPRHFFLFYARGFRRHPWGTMLEVVYQLYRLFSGQKKKRKITLQAKTDLIEVFNANDPVSHAFIKKIDPDVILLAGTSIIKNNILNLAKKGVINIHIGINPNYRGGGNPFAMLWGDWENIGVTVHCVDAGIDTGRPLAIIKISPSPDCPTLDEYNDYCYRVGLHELVKILGVIIKTGILPVCEYSQTARSQYFPQLNIVTYLQARKLYSTYVRSMKHE